MNPRRGQGWRIRGVNPGAVSDFVEAVEVGKYVLVLQRCTGAKPTEITAHRLRGQVLGNGGSIGQKTRDTMQTESGKQRLLMPRGRSRRVIARARSVRPLQKVRIPSGQSINRLTGLRLQTAEEAERAATTASRLQR